MPQLSFTPLCLSIFFSLASSVTVWSTEKEEMPTFESLACSNKTLTTIVEQEEKREENNNNLKAPVTPVLYGFQPTLVKVDSSLKLQPYCGSPIFKRSHLQHLYDSTESAQEATFNKTPPNSPPSPSPFSSKPENFKTISLIASVRVKDSSNLRRNYSSPFSLSIGNSALPSPLYTHEFYDIDKEFGKPIVLAEYFPINWERLPIYFAFTFKGYPKTKKQDTIFDLEINDNDNYKPVVIDSGKIEKGLYKRDLLKYCLQSGEIKSPSIAVYFDICLFGSEQTSMSVKVAKKTKDHNWF